MTGTWGCPHEDDGLCKRLNGAYCDPGMRGCVLQGKVEFVDGREHVPRWPEKVDGGGAVDLYDKPPSTRS